MSANSLLTILATVVPAFLIFLFIYSHDEHREPAKLIAKVTLFGALIAIPVIIVVSIIKTYGTPEAPLQRSFYEAFFWAAIPEELFKLLTVYWVAYNRKEFDEPFDGIIYATASSLGFAVLENFFYVSAGGIQLALVRAVSAIPLHLFCGLIMGYYIGRAKFTPKHLSPAPFWVSALILPITFHGVYDAVLFYQHYTMANPSISELAVIIGSMILPMVVIGIFLLRKMKKYNVYFLSLYYEIPVTKLEILLKNVIKSEPVLNELNQVQANQLVTLPVENLTETEKNNISGVHLPPPRKNSRGFLGLVYALLGSFGVLIFGLATLGYLSEFNEEIHKPLLLLLMGFSTFNFFLLFLKGFRRNREKGKIRSMSMKILLFVSYIGSSSIGIDIIKKIEEGDLEPSENNYIFLSIFSILWLIAFFNKSKKPE
ncbi:MAG: PrsW family glutamic-type intramembrane protease [Deltaproteobacteria bacterium]|jgi:RsiW-degrading membrane proteinase PrsW (M82 family)|nr:PrsW family glutamic-type intramembrane protease [Deltaproteobacteria bacterium]